ncbi:MAG: hypothetical protein NT007_09600 [Candidatus Kapabacteria bacterium]|nr:hypothetical protein [Candidatus Kapabacteria bacterium]
MTSCGNGEMGNSSVIADPVRKGAGGGGGTSDHAALTHLNFTSSGHTGFEATLTKGNLTEVTSSILTITGGTSAIIGSGLTIQVKQASGSQAGYLSSTDWTTFNNKLSSLTGAVLTDQAAGQTIGATGARLTKLWATDITVTNAITGSVTGNAATVTNATLTTPLTVNTGSVTLLGNAANTSALTIGAGSVAVSGANTGDQLTFKTIAVSGQSDVVADSLADTLTLVAGANVTITTDASTDTITITSAGGGGGSMTYPSGSGLAVVSAGASWGTTLGIGNLTEATSSVLTITGGTSAIIGSGLTIQVKQASGSQAGYLSSTDWTTFNNKLSSLTGAVLTDQAAGQTIGATGARLTKLWATDITVTNAITGSVTGSAATLSTPRAVYGNNFDGSSALTQVIAATYGGTGSAYVEFAGANTTKKTYTLPDFNSTILTDHAAVTVAQGGTGVQTLTTAYGVLCAGTTATGNVQTLSTLGTSGQVLTSNGASALPSFQKLSPRSTTLTSSAGITINSDTTDIGTVALVHDTTFTISGSPVNGQKLILHIVYSTGTHTIAFNAIVVPIGVTLPSITAATKNIYVGFIYNTSATKWHAVSVSTEA